MSKLRVIEGQNDSDRIAEIVARWRIEFWGRVDLTPMVRVLKGDLRRVLDDWQRLKDEEEKWRPPF